MRDLCHRGSLRDLHFFKRNRDLMTVRRRPVIEFNHVLELAMLFRSHPISDAQSMVKCF